MLFRRAREGSHAPFRKASRDQSGNALDISDLPPAIILPKYKTIFYVFNIYRKILIHKSKHKQVSF
jgi:hypothetical protein